MIERFSPKNWCFNCQDRQKMYAQRLRRNSEKYMSIHSKKGENYGIIIIHIHSYTIYAQCTAFCIYAQ